MLSFGVMPTPDERVDEQDETELALAEDGVHRLLDIITQEVSLVNRAANRRKWLVRKGTDAMGEAQELFEQGDGSLTTEETAEAPAESTEDEAVEKQMSMPKAIKDAVSSALTTAHGLAAKLAGHVKNLEEDDTMQGLPSMVGTELKALATGLRAINSRYPAPKAKGEGEEAETEEEPAQTEEVEQAKSEEDEAEVETESDNGTEKAGHGISAAMKQKVMAALEEGAKRLATLLEHVKAATESDEAASGIPGELAKEIEAVAAGFESLVGAYPSPKAAKTEEDEPKPHTETASAPVDAAPEESDEMEKGSPFSVLQEAKNVLGVVMAKLQPGQPIDEDSYQRLDKLRSLLGSSAPAERKDAEEQSEKGNVKKAGAKLASARRKQLEAAIKSLLSLFKEVLPAKDLGKFPHLVVSKSEQDAEQYREKLEKSEAALAKARQELAELKERPVDSQVAAVETATALSGGNDQVSWPLDLNAE